MRIVCVRSAEPLSDTNRPGYPWNGKVPDGTFDMLSETEWWCEHRYNSSFSALSDESAETARLVSGRIPSLCSLLGPEAIPEMTVRGALRDRELCSTLLTMSQMFLSDLFASVATHFDGWPTKDITVLVISPSSLRLAHIGWTILNTPGQAEMWPPSQWRNVDPRLNELRLNPLEGFEIVTVCDPLTVAGLPLRIHKHKRS